MGREADTWSLMDSQESCISKALGVVRECLETIRWSGTDEDFLSTPGPHVHLCRLSHMHACITHMQDHHCYWEIRLITLQELQLLSGSVLNLSGVWDRCGRFVENQGPLSEVLILALALSL